MQEFRAETASSDERTKKTAIDRLSSLPDSLLIHILSLVDVPRATPFLVSLKIPVDAKTAAVTSVLSKRWRYLWTELPALSFFEKRERISIVSKLVGMVNRALVFRTAKSLDQFEITIPYNLIWDSQIDLWLEFVLNSKVKKLSLNFHPGRGEQMYTPLQALYCTSSMMELSFGHCRVAPTTRIDWKSLTKLKISYVELHQDVVDSILSGCPVLYRMHLSYCWGFNSLKINSPSVHSIQVFDCYDERENRTLLEISAPYLKDLRAFVNPRRSKLQLTNISSLEKACIDLFPDESWDPKLAPENEMDDVKELFERTLHIAELELCPSFFEVLTLMVGNGWQLPQSRRISLTVETNKQNISGIISLLESSPNLEKLQIRGIWDPEEPPCWCPPPKEELKCDLEQLKMIKINDYAEPSLGGEPLLTLARILLKRAKVLENIRIVSSSYDDQDEFNELDVKVFSYPTLSETVKIENYRWIPPRS